MSTAWSLILEDGSRYDGVLFGDSRPATGEVVFNTGMTGYVEALTDPSYAGQILVLTYPLVGNYGVPGALLHTGLPHPFESTRIHALGLVVARYEPAYAHHAAEQSLGAWLQACGVPALSGVDTRHLTRRLRERGTLRGRLAPTRSLAAAREAAREAASSRSAAGTSGHGAAAAGGDLLGPDTLDPTGLVAHVSRPGVDRYEVDPDAPTLLLVDCGAKHNILRSLLARGVNVVRVPWDHDFLAEDCGATGLFLSNGPGDPTHLGPLIERVAAWMDRGRPVFGICLGHQILALAAGGRTYRLPYGHRSQNQPVRDRLTGRGAITSQNHGYAVDGAALPTGFYEWFVNVNDGTNEGIRHVRRPFMSVQFHPEAYPGPVETNALFDEFVAVLRECASPPPYLRPVPTKSSPERRAAARPRPVPEGAERSDRAEAPRPAPARQPVARPRKVLLLGSGALKIGEAGEFDYSGSQAIKALREESIQVVLVNPNIATIQTSEHLADQVYFLPVTPEFVSQVIAAERPDAILLGFGGQTALNCGLALHDAGVLARHGVRVLGTPVEAIRDTEDRDLFVQRLREIDVRTARSEACTDPDGVRAAAERIGYPVMLRGAFALGGKGSTLCADRAALEAALETLFSQVPQVLVEESLAGWKEIEYEVVADAHGNVVTVCNMENLDPMGVHTGESIVVAPSQTLNNHEYHRLRESALRTIRHLGVVGECNIQYALDPQSDDYRVIEVNARLSRSSALASKATGYPLAYIAAKIALGHSLLTLPNAVTGTTRAFFEPALDYCVVKAPRWDLEKFSQVTHVVGSAMKSVGEVMAIGRDFAAALQKALRMLQVGVEGLEGETAVFASLEDAIRQPNPYRIFALANALRQGVPVETLHAWSHIDPWFLRQLARIIDAERRLDAAVRAQGWPVPPAQLRELKRMGFADAQIARIVRTGPDGKAAPDRRPAVSAATVRAERQAHGILPRRRQIDTLAAEYPAQTNYLYLSYDALEDEVAPVQEDAQGRPRVLVLGSGVYRIGSSVEFDWSSVNAVRTARDLGYEVVLLNHNPETVSTDFDVCDRLVFDEISLETVLDLVALEAPEGVVVSVGGQVANNLALPLHRAGVPILGTPPESIDRAEDRHKFSSLCDAIGLDQPPWREYTGEQDLDAIAAELGFPMLVRPSYVLSGAAMRVVWDREQLASFLRRAALVSPDHPVVITRFETGSKEIEVDAVAHEGRLLAWAIAEHVENAGVHSGDATLVLPPQKLYLETVRRVKQAAARLAEALAITGPFNVQFLARNNRIQIIECNLRASRSAPFVSKASGVNFIEVATRAMLGHPPTDLVNRTLDLDYVVVKAPQFSFSRLTGADPMLGVEMASTGEVACFGDDLHEALLKALLAAGFRRPRAGRSVLLSIGGDEAKAGFVHAARRLKQMGLQILATAGTAAFLTARGVPATPLRKESEGGSPTVVQAIASGTVDLVVNIPHAHSPEESADGYRIRRAAVDHDVPLLTNPQLARLVIKALAETHQDALAPKPWSAYRAAPPRPNLRRLP